MYFNFQDELIMSCDQNGLHVTAWAAATYCIICYSLIFSFEIWFILSYNDSTDVLPTLAFILAAVYFVEMVGGILLVLALIMNSILGLIIWLTIMMITFFPECGLVLYISFYKWGIDTRNGQIELGLYFIRAILNVVFVACVQSLMIQWKNEKQTLTYHMTSYHNHNHNHNQSSHPYQGTANSSSTTINPVFKYTTSIKMMPTSEFDPKNLREMMCHQHDEGQFATQSLDRRSIKNFSADSYREEVVLHPLRHLPFDYLERPGSLNDLRMELERHRYLGSQERTSSMQSIRDVAL